MNPSSRAHAKAEALASRKADDQRDPAAAVTALYHEHALSLIRLAHIMLDSRAAAEDVVQDAFLGLYRRWEHLTSADNALSYVRSSVVNGCRSALRGSARLDFSSTYQVAAMSAEAAVLTSEDHRQLISALRRLPHSRAQQRRRQPRHLGRRPLRHRVDNPRRRDSRRSGHRLDRTRWRLRRVVR